MSCSLEFVISPFRPHEEFGAYGVGRAFFNVVVRHPRGGGASVDCALDADELRALAERLNAAADECDALLAAAETHGEPA